MPALSASTSASVCLSSDSMKDSSASASSRFSLQDEAIGQVFALPVKTLHQPEIRVGVAPDYLAEADLSGSRASRTPPERPACTST